MWCSSDSRGRSVPGAGAVILEVAAEDLGCGLGVRAIAKRRRVHPGAKHRGRDPGKRRRSHGLLGHLPARAEVRLEVAGAAVDADHAERERGVGSREGERDGGAPAVADHHERLGMAEPREQTLEIARDGVEVIAVVGPVAQAVPGQVDRDHPVRWHEPVGDQVPPARVARQPVEGQNRRLAAGMVTNGERRGGACRHGIRRWDGPSSRDCGR